MDDIGLQRAIWASLQSANSVRPAPRPAPVARPAGGSSSGSSGGAVILRGNSGTASTGGSFGVRRAKDIKPTEPRPRDDVAERRRLGQLQQQRAAPRSGGGAGGAGGGRSVEEFVGSCADPSDAPPSAAVPPLPPVAVPRRTASGITPPRSYPPSSTSSGAATAAGGSSGGSGGSGGVARLLPPGVDPAFVDRVEADIVTNLSVKWDDVVGLDEAKMVLNESIMLPQLFPEMFRKFSPCKGVLLFGPPGTGKTMLAKAVASCTNSVFFNISASSLLSRYHGESEKMVRTLFEVARARAPAIIFFDEVDALISSRGGGGGGSGGSETDVARRIKSELLQQIDGIASDASSSSGATEAGSSASGPKRVIIIGATNHPWDIDEAMRRRFEKRIYIPLPSRESIASQIAHCMSDCQLAPDVSVDEIARKCEGFNGADIAVLCRDVVMAQVRRIVGNRTPQQMVELRERGELKDAVGELTLADFDAARARINPSVSAEQVERYKKWAETFGST